MAEETEGVWRLRDGATEQGTDVATYTADGTENLTYNNPYGIELERVWFDGRVVYAVSGDEVEVEVSKVKVAQEYQVAYSVELDEQGKPTEGPELVDGQLNIYDSVPGMDSYSPLWQFNYVIVPRDYEPNSLRSEDDCVSSGYPIRQSTQVEN